MKLPLVGIEDYIWAVTALHLTQEGTNLWPSIIAGDRVENYIAPDGSMTLDLVDSNKTRFYLTFEGSSEILNILKKENYIGLYSCFFHNANGVEETVVEHKSFPFAFVISFVATNKMGHEKAFRTILSFSL